MCGQWGVNFPVTPVFLPGEEPLGVAQVRPLLQEGAVTVGRGSTAAPDRV